MKYDAQLIETIPRATDIVSFRFNRPSELTYEPGQYMLATLTVDGKDQMHPFSFSSSPTEEGFIEFTKKLTDSNYSKALRALKTGDFVKIDAPYGKFTFTGQYPKICMLAGGIGITPFWSICKYCTDKKVDASIVLLYGSRSENDIAFYSELNNLQDINPHIHVFYVLTMPSSSWKGLTGVINADLIKKQIVDYSERMFYACGPPGMVEAMKQVISDLRLPSTQLKLEVLSGHT